MRRSIFLFIIVVAAVTALALWYGKKQLVETPLAASTATNVALAAANPPATTNAASLLSLGGNPAASPLPGGKPNRLSTLSEELTEYTRQTPQPIEFYGKVVDENMQPVDGTTVSFNYNTYRPEASFSSSTATDANGLFSISGVKGITLSVLVNKEGYYSVRNSNQVQFVYLAPPGSLAFQPDPMAPVIFHLHKKSAGADLITSKYGVSPDLILNPPKDGTPVWVDLLRRKTGESGQLEVQSWLDVDPNTHRTQSWKLKLSIPGGGFVGVQDEFPLTPPESGYQTELNFPIPDENGNVRFGVSQKTFYIAFGDPRIYGRLEVNASEQTGAVWLQYAVNPDGSRNLEPAN